VVKGLPTVAIVDDDIRVLESLENLLESAGYSVRVFTGASALLATRYALIDCLITDIGMPGIDGFELIEIVKRAKPTMPVFLITGRHEIVDQQVAMSKNISGFFRKPFDAQRLLSEVSQTLHKSMDCNDGN
jgi:FixJ family two-component response regulator